MRTEKSKSLQFASKIYFSLFGDEIVAYRSDIGDDYMERWILRTPWGMLRLHHILRSDDDRALHDHPFDFCSLLLSGGYEEVRPVPVSVQHRYGVTRSYRWPRFSLVRRDASDAHRLILDKPVWTLVLTGPKLREWGFYTKSGWIHWMHYGGYVSPEEGRALTEKYRDQDKVVPPRRSRSGWIGALQELNDGLASTKQTLRDHGDKIESTWEAYKKWLRSL